MIGNTLTQPEPAGHALRPATAHIPSFCDLDTEREGEEGGRDEGGGVDLAYQLFGIPGPEPHPNRLGSAVSI